MNLSDLIARCIQQWPDRIEVTPSFDAAWGERPFLVPELQVSYDAVEDAVVGSIDEVPNRLIHQAILTALREGAVSFKVVRPRELQAAQVAKVLVRLIDEGSFDPELGYTDGDRKVFGSVAKSAAAMIG